MNSRKLWQDWFAGYDQLPLACLLLDQECNVLAQNRAAKIELGTIEVDCKLTQICPEQSASLTAWLGQQVDGPLKLELLDHSGIKLFVLHQQPYHMSDGRRVNIVTVQPLAELSRLYEPIELYRTVYKFSTQAICATSHAGLVRSCNPAFEKLFNCRSDYVIGKSIETVLAVPGQMEYHALLVEIARDRRLATRLVKATRHQRDGSEETFPCRLQVTQSKINGTGGYLHFFEDISDQVYVEKTLRQAANVDPLSGVLNRTGFNQLYSQAFEEVRRKGEPLTLAYIDLDRFKYVNDQYGHEYGDQLLKYAAERLVGSVKRSDIVARLGGDEFAVIIRGEMAPPILEVVATKMMQALGRPYTLGEVRYRCTCSIGLARYPEDAMEMESLIKAADNAMYIAKTSGRNQYRFYNREVQKTVAQRQQHVRDIELALEHHRIRPWYQPIYDMQSGTVIGLEALARRINNQQEEELPDSFIPLIEESEAMITLGLEIARQAVLMLDLLARSNIHLPININLSSFQLRSVRIIDYLCEIKEKKPGVVDWLKLEITETLLIDSDNNVIDHLRRLQEAGYRLVLDDFGTGHSSISTLRALPFEGVKIDKSFIADIKPGGADNNKLLVALLQLVKAVDLEVVCEGVEEQEQIDFVTSQQCRFGQGFYYAKPMPAAAALSFLKGRGKGRGPGEGNSGGSRVKAQPKGAGARSDSNQSFFKQLWSYPNVS